MNRVIKASPDRLKILVVGDSKQLPSIGPGQSHLQIYLRNKINSFNGI